MDRGQKTQRDIEAGQHGLFGVFDEPHEQSPKAEFLDGAEWDEHQRLAAEKEILGFFITGHPLQKYESKLVDFGALSTQEIGAMKQSTGKDEILTAGIITNVRVAKSRKGELYAQGVLEDMLGTVDMVVFPEAYRRLAEKVKLEVPVLVKGGVRVEEGANPKVLVGDIEPLEQAKPRLPRAIRIRVPLETATIDTVDVLQAHCVSHPGEAKVLFDVERAGDFMVIMEPEGYNVQPDRAFIARVEELCGRGSVRIVD
jgi:DNA polymerase-3 subunit alpha